MGEEELKKICRRQSRFIWLLIAMLGVNLGILGIGLWQRMGEEVATKQPVPPPLPAAPQETVDLLGDLTDTGTDADTDVQPLEEKPSEEKRAEEEPLEASAVSIDRSQKRIRESLNKMQQEAEQQQRRAKATTTGSRPSAAATCPESVVTRSGMTLRSLARRYYDSEVFWVCIYDRNSPALHSPDVLPLGMRLYLPRPADYGIDASDPSSLRRARALAKSLMGQ